MRTILIAAAIAVGALAAWSCRGGEGSARKAIDEQERLFVQAMNEEHVDGLMAIYWNSPDLIALYPTGNYRGYDTVKQMWWNFFNTVDVRKYEITERHPVVSGDVAYEWGLYDFSYQAKGGPVIQSPGRFLLVWEYKDKRWVITAEHSSVPSASGLPAGPALAETGPNRQ